MLIKLLNFLLVVSVMIFTASIIRVITYAIIGISNERIFSNGMFWIWGVTLTIIIVRFFYLKAFKNK